MADRQTNADIARRLLAGGPHVFTWKTFRSLEVDNPLNLVVTRFRIRMGLLAPMVWHDFNGPMLRGAFGNALHAVDAHGAYAAIFDDSEEGSAPRPYRLWGCQGVHTQLPEGTVIEFGFDLYGLEAARWIPAVVEAWKRAAKRGLGEARKPAVLIDIAPVRPPGFPFPKVARLSDWIDSELQIGAVEFLSPTAMKHNGRICKPTPRLVVESAVRRLAGFCGVPLVPPETDAYWEWLESREIDIPRKSSRAGESKVHGWVGYAEFDDDVEADAALALKVGEIIGVGRHTVFGLGDYELTE